MQTDLNRGRKMLTHKKIKCRFACIEDAAEICQILNHWSSMANINGYGEPAKQSDIENIIRAHDGQPYPLLVATNKFSNVVGYAMLSPVYPLPGFYRTAAVSIYCHKDYCGLGIGSKLLTELISVAQQKRTFYELRAVIVVSNCASIRLHEKHGFSRDSGAPLSMEKCGVTSQVSTWIKKL